MVSNATWEVSGVGSIFSGARRFKINDHKYEFSQVLGFLVSGDFNGFLISDSVGPDSNEI